MPLLYSSYYFYFPTGNEPENTEFGRVSTMVWTDFSQKLKIADIFSGLARKGERELKTKSKGKLEESWEAEKGIGEDKDIKDSFASLRTPLGLPCLSSSVIKNLWEGYRGDCLILSMGEGREDTGREYTRLWIDTKSKKIALLSKFLNLRSANYSPNLDYIYFYKESFIANSQAHSFTYSAISASPL